MNSSRVNRRDFLRATAVTTVSVLAAEASAPNAGAAGAAGAAAGAQAQRLKLPSLPGLVDTNVTLGRWPFRRLPLDETPALVARLRQQGVTQAWAGTFNALLHKDIGSANARLAADCRQHGRGLLLPFGALNPTLPDWEEELRRCHEEFKMAGVRLYPNYHGYTLADERFGRLLDLAAQRGLVVQVAVLLEDERTQPALVRVPAVDIKPLEKLLSSRPKVRLQLLNWPRTVPGPMAARLAAAQVYFDIACVENVGGIEHLFKQLPPERLLFGSHAPFFYLESALLKLSESQLTPEQLAAIGSRNARRLLAL